MKEYIKNFEDAAAANNYPIADIPFTTSVATDPIQNLVCNESGKKLVNVSGTIQIQSAGPEMVDLGLSVKWAKYNIGATPGSTKESYYGNFYAWGGTQTQESYYGNNCPYCTLWDYDEGMYTFTKYVPTDMSEYWGGEGDPDNKLVLDLTDDVANVTYGADYRMPTKEEIQELLNLPNKWVTNFKGISGLNGRIFAKTQVELDGTFNDDTMLFIPAAGRFDGSSHDGAGSDCYLWSSSLYSGYPSGAWGLNFYSDDIGPLYNDRYYGFSVRCVSAD